MDNYLIEIYRKVKVAIYRGRQYQKEKFIWAYN